MIKNLCLFTACAMLTGSVLADQPTIYTVNVSDNTNPGFDVYLTQASEISGCQIYWPDSKLPLGGTTTFTLKCDGNFPPALKLSFITDITHNQGQTCWGTYNTAQFISNAISNLAIHPNFTSYGTCGTSVNPPTILLSHPDPGK